LDNASDSGEEKINAGFRRSIPPPQHSHTFALEANATTVGKITSRLTRQAGTPWLEHAIYEENRTPSRRTETPLKCRSPATTEAKRTDFFTP